MMKVISRLPFVPKPPSGLRILSEQNPTISSCNVIGHYDINIWGQPITFSYRFPIVHLGCQDVRFDEVFLSWNMGFTDNSGKCRPHSVHRRLWTDPMPIGYLCNQIHSGFVDLMEGALCKVLS